MQKSPNLYKVGDEVPCFYEHGCPICGEERIVRPFDGTGSRYYCGFKGTFHNFPNKSHVTIDAEWQC